MNADKRFPDSSSFHENLAQAIGVHGMNTTEAAEATRKSRPTVYKALENPEVQARIQHYRNRMEDEVVRQGAWDKLRAADQFQEFAPECAAKVMQLAREARSENVQLQACRMILEATGDAKPGSQEQHVQLIITDDLRKNIERLGNKEKQNEPASGLPVGTDQEADT